MPEMPSVSGSLSGQTLKSLRVLTEDGIPGPSSESLISKTMGMQLDFSYFGTRRFLWLHTAFIPYFRWKQLRGVKR